MTGKKSITAQIIELASRPEGIGSRDIEGIGSDDLSARCNGLVRRGRLYKAGQGRGYIRFFTRITDANLYSIANEKDRQPRTSISKNAKPVITSKTKITICPPWQPRFQAVDLPHIHTANQRGRVLSEVA